MKKLNKKKLLLLAGFILLFLAACANNTGADGKIKPEKIIYLSTTFSEVMSGSWFDAIFVWPFSQLINYISQYVDVVWGIGLATVIVNLITLPLTISSQESQQKMQMIKPEQDKIEKKYEGRKDENSVRMKAAETSALYKKHNINPFSLIVGMFVQFPIIMAMFYAVQRADSVIEGSFLGHSLKITSGTGIQSGELFYIIIFVIMGIFQFLSMKLPSYLAKQELKKDRRIKEYDKPENTGPNMEIATYIMVGMILFISLQWPSAMAVYWIFSGLMNVLKTLYVQKIKMKK